MADDPRLCSESSRYTDRTELEARLEPVFMTRTSREWIDLLRTGGVPCGPVNSVADAMSDEQFAAREMWRHVRTTSGGATLLNSPTRSDGVSGPRRGAADVGADTRAILNECKVDDDEIDALIGSGVVAAFTAQ
jgi:crotonobetainyl-CoA:carnitine CoA-transferase CaiB-like acyl-CoA transferase